MKHLIVILFIVFCSAEIFAQNISGTYRWDLDNGRRNFVISLSPKNAILGTTPTSFKGEHCGVFENGNRMDCSYEEYSISLNKWEVTKHGGGTTYFPENVMMEQY